jgi:hypothetical protein
MLWWLWHGFKRSRAAMSSPQPSTLDKKIDSLAPEVAEVFRKELPLVLSTLRAAHNPKGVLLQMSPLELHVLREVFKRADQIPPSDNLWDCIMRAGRGTQTPKIEGLGLLPRTIEQYLEPLRDTSNRVLFSDSKRQLWHWKQAVMERLADLRLTIHPQAQKVVSFR